MKKITQNILGITGVVVIVGTLVAGIVVGFKLQDATENITYTLDSDIEVKTIENDIEIVTDSEYPGVNIRHKDRNNNDFNVLAFTDFHLDHNQNTCNYTFSMIARNVMHANPKPDLIVFCGDNITSSFNEARTKELGALMEKLGVYWTAILGNHERNESNPYSISREDMIGIWANKSKFPHCLIDDSTKKTLTGKTVWGVGNHVVNLLNHDNNATQSLFMLDSGTEMSQEDKEKYKDEIQLFKDMGKAGEKDSEFYDYIKDSQVEWYSDVFSKVKYLNANVPVHSTIFTHVPLKEYQTGYLHYFNEVEKEENKTLQGTNKVKVKVDEVEKEVSSLRPFTDYPQESSKDIKDMYGKDNNYYIKGENMRRRENVCDSPHDYAYEDGETPIFKTMASFGPDNALFCGHDHQNNFAFKYKNVILGYIQPGCYSSNNLYTKGMLQGAKKITDREYSDPELISQFPEHLIQGYSQLTYKHKTEDGQNSINVLRDFKQISNYDAWKDDNPNLYKKAITLINAQKGKYEAKQDIYLDYYDDLN